MKQKLRVRLIRHGEKRLFMPDPRLTELGRAQAENLGQKLAKDLAEKIKADKVLLFASPAQRTRETAHIIARALSLKVKINQALYLDDRYADNEIGRQALLNYFQTLAVDGVEELLLVTHSQNIRHYWQVLGGPEKMIADIEECGCWTVEADGDKLEFRL